MNKMDKEIFNKAIQNYVKDSKKNISESYAVRKGIESSKTSKRFDWSVVVMADIAASVLAKLRNKAKASRHQLSAVSAAYLCRKNF